MNTIGLALAVLSACAVRAAEFHVDSAAASGGDGSVARPFATLAAARDGVRAARASGKVANDEPIDVVLAPGDYFGTLALYARDGGASESAYVTWRAEKPGTARIIGARRIPNSKFALLTDSAVLARIPVDARGRVWRADVSDLFPNGVPDMAKSFRGMPPAPVLFVDDRFGTIARWPNDGFAVFSTCVDRGAPEDATEGAFVYTGYRARRWNFDEGVWMNGYWTHDWYNHSVKCLSYGTENGTNSVVRLAVQIPYGVMGGTWGRKNRRFYAFNLLDELDAPGEWWLDRTGKILYLCPPSGTLGKEDEVFLASSDEPLLDGRGICHVRFEGIVFEYSYGTGIALSGSDIRLENCRVLCCGAGVVLDGDGNLMRRCEVARVGGVGVSASGGDRRTLRRADSVFESNHIHDFGEFQRTYAPGFRVGGCGIVLRGNSIHDAPHTAILYGGNEHLFEYNNVYRVLLETGDAGAYYTGRDWTTQGNVLRFNYTHDLGSENEHASSMGFYFDDCDCGDEVYGNVFHNVSRGIMVGGGREHPIRNNIFSHCLIGLSIDCRGMKWKQWNVPGGSWHLEGKANELGYTNGVWAARYPRLADIMNDHPREPLYNPVENNIFIDCRSQLVAIDKDAPLERMAPIANNVVVNTCGTNGVEFASPDSRIASGFTVLNGAGNAPCAFGVADAERGDFRFLPGSEVLKVCPGFEPLPLDRIAKEMGEPDGFALLRAEFDRYFLQITGRNAPDGLVSFAIDPKVSSKGKDAYRIVSRQPAGVAVTGSNLRSVWYGLYDLLERRGGCHWFWDGDIVPKKDAIDLSGLDVTEEAHFEYRAIRYFAHRGLTRFQAEHWGLDDWKKEIDWMLKRRLNTFMLRIGQDDVYQRAFPDICPYPDASRPQCGMHGGYNDRTLFWSLEFRGRLRRDIHKYAFDRGLMAPEDFGTMTHWYSPTPDSYLMDRKPPFLPQVSSSYSYPNLRVWDVREGDWAEEYWKITKAAIAAYGNGAPEPRLLHTIGLGERRCYENRNENFNLKVETLDRFRGMAKRDYPDAKLLVAGWDFFHSWTNEEVRKYLKTLDKNKVILWDYEADATRGDAAHIFTNWDVVGNFPYTYSVFLAYEKALDARANYPVIEERQKLSHDDPLCKGYIFWPESSHTDTLLLRYFTANAWSGKMIPHGDVLAEFCSSRYGEHATQMKEAWKTVLPASWLRDWGNNFSTEALGIGGDDRTDAETVERWKKPVSEAVKVFDMLACIPWRGEFVQRDAVDIARMTLDRAITLSLMEFSLDFTAWRSGIRDGSDLTSRAERIALMIDRMADLLALHTDFSLWESYRRMDAVENIRNTDFEKTLFENASCAYCRSHQFEFVRYWYPAHVRAVAGRIAKAVANDTRDADVSVDVETERLALKARPLESLRPNLPRTEENFRKTMNMVIECLDIVR